MAQEVGKLVEKKLDSGVSQKTGKPWQKLTFVIQAKGKFPRKVQFETFDVTATGIVQDSSDGTVLKVEYSPESREWNGRYFTSLKAWSVEVTKEEEDDLVHKGVKQMNAMYDGAPKANISEPEDDTPDLPF